MFDAVCDFVFDFVSTVLFDCVFDFVVDVFLFCVVDVVFGFLSDVVFDFVFVREHNLIKCCYFIGFMRQIGDMSFLYKKMNITAVR